MNVERMRYANLKRKAAVTAQNIVNDETDPLWAFRLLLEGHLGRAGNPEPGSMKHTQCVGRAKRDLAEC